MYTCGGGGGTLAGPGRAGRARAPGIPRAGTPGLHWASVPSSKQGAAARVRCPAWGPSRGRCWGPHQLQEGQAAVPTGGAPPTGLLGGIWSLWGVSHPLPACLGPTPRATQLQARPADGRALLTRTTGGTRAFSRATLHTLHLTTLTHNTRPPARRQVDREPAPSLTVPGPPDSQPGRRKEPQGHAGGWAQRAPREQGPRSSGGGKARPGDTRGSAPEKAPDRLEQETEVCVPRGPSPGLRSRAHRTRGTRTRKHPPLCSSQAAVRPEGRGVGDAQRQERLVTPGKGGASSPRRLRRTRWSQAPQQLGGGHTSEGLPAAGLAGLPVQKIPRETPEWALRRPDACWVLCFQGHIP